MTCCQVYALLIPKVLRADAFNKYRPIASLSTFRKLMGYVAMGMLPKLNFESFQTGFVPGGHAGAGVYVMKRAAELAREWGLELYVAQIDLCKAFDRVKHSAAIRALKLQSASLQCIAVFCAIMKLSAMSFSLGGIQAGPGSSGTRFTTGSS